MRTTRVVLVVLAAGLGLAASAASAVAAPTVSTVMTGLDNPRGLAFGAREALYVAEAGRGGDTPCGLGGPKGTFYGQTGAVSRLLRGQQERIATGLPSTAEAGGVGATGPHSIDFRGRNGRLTSGSERSGRPRVVRPGQRALRLAREDRGRRRMERA